MRVLITGGAGFIGSNFLRYVLKVQPDWEIFVIDAFKYSGHEENLVDLPPEKVKLFRIDISDKQRLFEVWKEIKPETVFHLAAESHVDRSILSPENFVQTNVYGTFCLLEAARLFGANKFIHISTDEVYGSISYPEKADENFLLHPSSPYSASKASSDLLALSYFKTYGTPVLITRSSNNYGPRQTPEKFIPLAIYNLLNDKPIPIYGDGQQIRNWIFVEDNCEAILQVALNGRIGEIYNIGSSEPKEVTNLEIAKKLCYLLGKSESLIKFVKDRPAHDRRYSIDCSKIIKELGWSQRTPFEKGLQMTVEWYQSNIQWLEAIRSKLDYFFKQNYENR